MGGSVIRNSSRWKELGGRIREAACQRRCYDAAAYQEARLLRKRKMTGEVVEPFPGLFAFDEYWSKLGAGERERHIIKAYGRQHPEAVFCSTSAAVMHRLPVSYSDLGSLHIYTSVSAPSSSSSRVVRRQVNEIHKEIVDGVAVADIVYATAEAMCDSSFENGLAIADAALRRLKIERDLLGEVIEKLAAGHKGVEVAREVARYADGRAESGGESIARAVMIREGILPSDLQREFQDPLDSQKTYRVDFVFELASGKTVIGEFDGRSKYEDPVLRGDRTALDVLREERQRESHITLLGMPVLRFTWNDVRQKGRLVEMLRKAGVTPDTLAGRDYRAVTKAVSWGLPWR